MYQTAFADTGKASAATAQAVPKAAQTGQSNWSPPKTTGPYSGTKWIGTDFLTAATIMDTMNKCVSPGNRGNVIVNTNYTLSTGAHSHEAMSCYRKAIQTL